MELWKKIIYPLVLLGALATTFGVRHHIEKSTNNPNYDSEKVVNKEIVEMHKRREKRKKDLEDKLIKEFYFEKKADFVNSFAAINYAHG